MMKKLSFCYLLLFYFVKDVQSFINSVLHTQPLWTRCNAEHFIDNHRGCIKKTTLLASRTNNDEAFIKDTLNEIGKSITKGRGAKEINLELVARGQKFDSYQRRFDYFSLLQALKQDEGNSIGPPPSTWIRDNELSSNVVEFLYTTREMMIEDARIEAKKIHTQSYRRIITSDQEEKLDTNRRILSDLNYYFETKTHLGMPTISDENININYDCQANNSTQKRISWEGKRLVMDIVGATKNDGTNPVTHVEKFLSFLDRDGIDNNSVFLIVESTFYPDGIDEKWRSITCQEVFRPVYSLQGHEYEKRQLPIAFPSGMQRVPGCIASVNIQTILISKGENKESFHVMLDGEADAFLSRGILAVLSSVISTLDTKAVLGIDFSTIADDLKLSSVLSPGRNDGLANMVKIVQSQIRCTLEKMNSGDKTINEGDNIIDSSEKKQDNFNTKCSKNKTVAMLLSGGVDSAVALNLLKRQNYDVTAFYLKIWLEDELSHLGQCPWEDDYKTCVSVCQHAGGIPLETISLQDAYKERVISYTIRQAKKGRTPNPDIMCNSRIKFGVFYDAIADRGFDYVASGHYAQLEKVFVPNDNGSAKELMRLLRAPDPVKDQSYFLAALRQDQLERVLFPIGHLQKPEVRALAEEFDLPNKSRPDSQGLCFLGKVKFDKFLSAYLGNDPGDIVDAHTGETIGRHNGIWYHTVGQRKGIGKVLNPKATSRGPWYVVAKDPANRKIIASNKYDEDIFDETRSQFFVEDIRWISGLQPQQLKSSETNEIKFILKIRHGPTLVNGTLRFDSSDNTYFDAGTIILEEKDGGLAPGQFVAFYDGIECLGSGVISEKHWLKYSS
mmetsp:Transcript_1432/g.1774  ORF Transcript_1432/g.1774 Transcript_1432/m.1774 type:complete len:842 (+) Transcript_1432:24-2549(+)